MGHQRAAAAKLQEPRQLHGDRIGVPHHVVPDAGKLGDTLGNGLGGLYIAMELVLDSAAGDDTGGDLNDLAVGGGQTGGLGVEHHDLVGEKGVTFALDGVALLQIVNAVGLDAVQHLDV